MNQDIKEFIHKGPMSSLQVIAISVCLVINMLDGFDVLVMAFTASHVSNEWGLSGSELGILLSAGLFGMAGGSLFLAPYADKYGRRTIALFCLIIISVSMFLSAMSQGMTQLAILRAITGVGIGGMLASLNVIVAEYASDKWRSLAVSFLQTGYPIGAAIGGSIAAFLIVQTGWRSVFVFGAVTSAIMIPIVIWRLPESMDYLLAKRPCNALKHVNDLLRRMGRDEIETLPEPVFKEKVVSSGFVSLFKDSIKLSTLLIWSSFFMVMFSFYFVLSWTPKLLVAAGLSAEQGISGGVLLNVGGIVGGLLLGYMSSRFNLQKLIGVYMLATAALMIIFGILTSSLTTALVISLFIGFFLFGSMIGLYALAPNLYTASIRTTGMGWAIGIGRIGAILSPFIAGVLLDAGWGTAILFIVFALPLTVSMITVNLIRAN
ncbi:MAG: MFS transporter [Candidatus Scalinduaceae bacterium]